MVDKVDGWPKTNDDFDPPLTNAQMSQVQGVINDVLSRKYKVTSIKPVDISRDIEQLAMFMNGRDVIEHGTAKWEQLDHAGREEYEKDARLFISALLRLGWAKQAVVES